MDGPVPGSIATRGLLYVVSVMY